MMPYVCEGTIVKTTSGREGKIIGANERIVIIEAKGIIFSENRKNIKVVSYKEVK